MAKKKKPAKPKPKPARGVGRPLAMIDESTLAGQLGAKIRAARLARGLTIEALAAALDVPEPSVRHWEHGRRCLPIGQATPLCWALGISVTDLVKET